MQPQDTIEIPLTQGKVAIIDAADWDLVKDYKWCAIRAKNGRWYAAGRLPGEGQYSFTQMHRLLLDAPPRVDVDHRDLDGLNNRRSNIRIATRSQNQANARIRSTNTSGYKGVHFHGPSRRWQARITLNYHRRPLGMYATAEEAGRAYDAAARVLFGEFARLNFPDHSDSSRE